MKKKLMTLLLALVLAVSAMAVSAAAVDTTGRFHDVTDEETILAVESLRLLGALDGYGDGTFRPNDHLTRAQFCKIAVYAMNGESELGLYRTITVFPDVKSSHWASAYVNMAAKGKSLIAGYPDGAFHPEETVTAGQAVTILLRLLGYQDKDIGGVWPESYMALAERIGLTAGVKARGREPLNRAETARLFLNLLRSQGKEGGSYLDSIGGQVIEDVVLVSSSAVGGDGRPTAMQTSNGDVYAMANKASNGVLNGHRGDLVLNRQGKVLTFVPTDIGSGTAVTISSASATKITAASGAKFTVSRDAQAYYGGEQKAWSEVYAWLNAGTAATLYTGASGSVEYVFVGSAAAEVAVVVQENGSTAGFDAISGGRGGYAIYKNGAPATAGDLRKYDVATYSAATNTIRVCDTRVTVYYEDCSPSPKEPMEITVLGGTKLDVLSSGMGSVADFKPGKQMTLLLTEDGRVAGATGTSTKANAIGIVQNGQVQMLCGSTRVHLGSAKDVADYEGQLVRISAGKEGVELSTLTGGVEGKLSVSQRKLGKKDLADNVMILEGVKSIALSDITTDEVPASSIAYARTNWSGEVDLIQIGDSKGGTVFYGRAVVDTHSEFDEFGETVIKTLNVQYIKDGAAAESGAYQTGYQVRTGDYVAATLRGGRFAQVTKLEKLKDVPNSAWSSPDGVTVGGRFYAVAEDVLCYNKTTGKWMTLSAGHAYAEESNLYVLDGIVRVVEIEG